MKKKILHTRIPEELFDEIMERAKKNRTTISSLVRNLVEDFLDIGNDVTDLASEKARDLLFGEEDAEIVGYQPLQLVRDTPCSQCETMLKKGTSAYLAFTENATHGEMICKKCLDQATVAGK